MKYTTRARLPDVALSSRLSSTAVCCRYTQHSNCYSLSAAGTRELAPRITSEAKECKDTPASVQTGLSLELKDASGDICQAQVVGLELVSVRDENKEHPKVWNTADIISNAKRPPYRFERIFSETELDRKLNFPFPPKHKLNRFKVYMDGGEGECKGCRGAEWRRGGAYLECAQVEEGDA